MTGKRKKGKGLEVPCVYLFTGSGETIVNFTKSVTEITNYLVQLYKELHSVICVIDNLWYVELC